MSPWRKILCYQSKISLVSLWLVSESLQNCEKNEFSKRFSFHSETFKGSGKCVKLWNVEEYSTLQVFLNKSVKVRTIEWCEMSGMWWKRWNVNNFCSLLNKVHRTLLDEMWKSLSIWIMSHNNAIQIRDYIRDAYFSFSG